MKVLTPLKAIRERCIDCSGYQLKEVRLCTATHCPLWPYRMGKRPPKASSTDSEFVPKIQETD